MSEPNWSVHDAKNRFSQVAEAMQRPPQSVTKLGKPAVVVMDVTIYEAPAAP